MSDVKIDITIVMEPRAQEILSGWGSDLGTAFRRLETAVEFNSKALVPHDYSKLGRLRQSITGNSKERKSNSQGIWFEVGSSKPYALFVESGTRPHTIKPKRADGHLVFHWRKVGRRVRMKSVSHPGNRAYRYLENGLTSAFSRWISTT